MELKQVEESRERVGEDADGGEDEEEEEMLSLDSDGEAVEEEDARSGQDNTQRTPMDTRGHPQ